MHDSLPHRFQPETLCVDLDETLLFRARHQRAPTAAVLVFPVQLVPLFRFVVGVEAEISRSRRQESCRRGVALGGWERDLSVKLILEETNPKANIGRDKS